MSELPETTTTSAPPSVVREPKPYWLYRFAAWVGIVAGIVFIVSSIFFAGVYVSKGGWQGPHHCRHHHSMMHQGPHHRGPGPMAPGPQGPGPGEVPPSASPAPPSPPGR